MAEPSPSFESAGAHPSRRIPGWTAPVAFVLVAAAGCNGPLTPLTPIAPTLDASPATTVLLVGDGGAVTDASPILDQIQADARRSSVRGPTVVAFLGDNVYPSGVRAEQPEHDRDTTRLALQLGAVAGSGARAIFVPGNHDWAGGSEGGLRALDRQVAWVRAAEDRGVPVAWLPAAGCPGPAVVDVGRVRLVVLDTQWFLHEHARRCADRPRDRIFDALTEAFDGAGEREVLLLLHHPLRSHGPHGGYFPPDRHLFPLRDLWDDAYVPLPVLGSAYVLARAWGISDQDLEGDRNERMRADIEAALRGARRVPRIVAAGHEHSLQVLRGPEGGALYHLVSGSASKVTPVARVEETLFAASRVGYLKVEVAEPVIRISAVVTPRSSPEALVGWCLTIQRGSGADVPC